jgi:hypothetical protein
MRLMEGRGRRTIGIVVLAVLAAAANAGIAGGTIKFKKSTISLVADGDEQSTTATCKRGLRAVAGGFNGPGFVADGDGPYQIPLTSLRESKRKWTGSAVDDADGGPYTVIAVCSDELPKLKQKSATTTIPEDEDDIGTTSAKCPRGGEAVSGGFVPEIADADGSDFNFVTESRRTGKRGWQVTAYNNSSEPLDLSAFVYCAKEKLGLKTKSAATETSSTNVNISAKAKCPKGHRAISGGFRGTLQADPDTFSREVFSQPFVSRPADKRGWLAGIGAYPDPGFVDELKTFAYCLKKEKKG